MTPLLLLLLLLLLMMMMMAMQEIRHFRKFGHTHIGKRVLYYFLPPSSSSTESSSSTVYIDGTITGYLSPRDTDSVNAPAFVCSRTHRPVAFYRVVFDAGNNI
jgi:hypothetical protein